MAPAHNLGSTEQDHHTPGELLPIGAVARRAGVPVSTVRYYESLGLIPAIRSVGNNRMFPRHVLRRIALIQTSVKYGVQLSEVAELFVGIPTDRPPTPADWNRIAARWSEHLERRQAVLDRMREELSGCIGCGCLSQTRCAVLNSEDRLGDEGSGPRRVIA